MPKFQVELSEELYSLIDTRMSKFHKSLFAEIALSHALDDEDIMKNIPHKNKKMSVKNDNLKKEKEAEISFTIDDDFK